MDIEFIKRELRKKRLRGEIKLKRLIKKEMRKAKEKNTYENPQT